MLHTDVPYLGQLGLLTVGSCFCFSFHCQQAETVLILNGDFVSCFAQCTISCQDIQGKHILELHREYKRILQRKKRLYKKAVAEDLNSVSKTDPQEYWRFWKKHKKVASQGDYIDVSTFTSYTLLGQLL